MIDKNGDGVIDDLLIGKKKPGRKSLNLTPEEMKAHREELRKKRLANKRRDDRRSTIEELVWKIIELNDKYEREAFTSYEDLDEAEAYHTKLVNGLIDELTDDGTLLIKRVDQVVAGYNGKRLRRPRG